MSEQTSKEIISTVTSAGDITISITNVAMPKPSDNEVLIKVEAAPINPSDLALLTTFAADLGSLTVSGSGDDTVASMKVRPALMKAMTPRLDQPMQAGNEGSGVVVDAGVNAKELIGKTVGVAGGAMYSQYRCVPASSCLVMDDNTTSAEAASSFVNPLTALAFIETMKMENHTAIVNTAAASNLGQMLVKICKDDGIALVNIVRKAEHVEILKNLGAEYVVNTSDATFTKDLVAALIATGATLAFDATGGGNEGKLPGQILAAMEVAANATAVASNTTDIAALATSLEALTLTIAELQASLSTVSTAAEVTALATSLAAAQAGDFATALKEWKPLAEAGDVDAQYNLGIMYDNGYGVPQDYAEAVKW